MQITQLNNQQALQRVLEVQTSALEMHREERVPARQLRVNASAPQQGTLNKECRFNCGLVYSDNEVPAVILSKVRR